jgi:LPS O-antigen subunit length determinant protein (WzzB/FepE family)
LQNNTQYIQEDKIDLRELFSVLKRKKKLIWTVTGLFTMLALIYVLVATPWWEVNTTLEIGKYIDTKTGNEIYLEDGAGVAERLKVKYINIYEHIKDRSSKVESISASKDNPQFISISALGEDNQLALTEIKNVIDDLKNKHKMIIDEIIAKKQSSLDEIDRNIYKIEHYQKTNITEKINYIKNVELPSIDKKITTVKSNLKKSIKQKDEAVENLSSLNNDASLAALRLAQIQGLEYKISKNEMELINLNTAKQKTLSTTLPELVRKIEKIEKIDLVKLIEKRKLIKLSMQPHNYHNTTVIGKIITQDRPVKPKKKLIVIIAFITGLMLSIFLAFFLEFIQGMKKEDTE